MDARQATYGQASSGSATGLGKHIIADAEQGVHDRTQSGLPGAWNFGQLCFSAACLLSDSDMVALDVHFCAFLLYNLSPLDGGNP